MQKNIKKPILTMTGNERARLQGFKNLLETSQLKTTNKQTAKEYSMSIF